MYSNWTFGSSASGTRSQSTPAIRSSLLRSQTALKTTGSYTDMIESADDEASNYLPSPTTPTSSRRLSSFSSEWKKKPSFMTSELKPVEILIIEDDTYEQSSHFVHRDFIAYYSGFFSAAFNGHFAEATEDSMRYHAFNEKAFRLFLHWSYTQEIGTDDDEPLEATELVNLYIEADKLRAPKLQNQVIDLICKLDFIPSYLFHKVYENTIDTSPLRKVFVDKCTTSMLKSIDFLEEYPPQMLVDIVNAMKKNASSRKKSTTKAERAKYYVSEELFGRA
ncbi:hypothetical protein BP6252_09445 [Coleophoma cylindrospora]|uniref:BTB domain-containing protein n=1 Tax=Coleophoma cylindrospora TaxID=1849047 RepID=A0A3D8R1Y4_9HELO|nr:hypothetical protein BP6252_09445 [Coleophoma cylindrospora]